MANSCRELLPIIDIVDSLGDAVGHPKDFTIMHVPIHKDNDGALILAETLPPECMPQRKHYARTNICFVKR